MKGKGVKRPHGQIRQSQVVTTFGPGSLVDLPDYSVLIGGLDHWRGLGEAIHEPRLVEKLETLLDLPMLRLHAPPPDPDDPKLPTTGITAWQFPEWFITQDVEAGSRGFERRSRLLIPRRALTKGKYIDDDKKKRSVVPIRFVRACRRGHIGDVDWYHFVHVEDQKCRRQLFIDELGTSGDLAEIWVRCACGEERPMSQAAAMEFKALGDCDGARPWLGPHAGEHCGEPNRLLVRTASNAYFPQVMSVISLPDKDERLVQAVTVVWEHHLQYVDTLEELKRDRSKKPPVKEALEGFSDQEILEEIQRRKTGTSATGKSVKQAEIEILTASEEQVGTDRPDGEFYARAIPADQWSLTCMQPVKRVVMVHRLREVAAQVGFTRFEPISPDVEGELEIGVRRAALARETTWLPAIENRGEGVFLQIDSGAVESWLESHAVQKRGKELDRGFQCWKQDHKGTKRVFPGLPYILVHSLSHMLLSTVALECGYPASSIRERIYAGAGGYGILLYTGSSDAEGTLGGLVDVGRRIDRHLAAALESGKLCSNDPVCAQHNPRNELERRFLTGAACHGCLLISETSCEMHNDFLDRALVVPTVENLGAEFFGMVEA